MASYSITDVFGIPGGAIVPFLDELNNNTSINVHLSATEFSAGYSAIGYSQATNSIGAVYATKGGGITNLFTPISDAFYDSVGLLIVTTHSYRIEDSNSRIRMDQDIDLGEVFYPITKKVLRIENLDGVESKIKSCLELCISGRKGPVIIDVLASLWNMEVANYDYTETEKTNIDSFSLEEFYTQLSFELVRSKLPLILVGNGCRGKKIIEDIGTFSLKYNVPIISSRSSQDLFSGHRHYFGYIGSRGTRYSNRILFNADLIIVIGNRLSTNIDSESYREVFQKRMLIIDTDKSENKKLINSIFFEINLEKLRLNYRYLSLGNSEASWIKYCCLLKGILHEQDVNNVVKKITEIINQSQAACLISDVGNNELWLSRAYEYSSSNTLIIYSRSLSVLGCSIPKSIGAHLANRKQVLSFVGDQGFLSSLNDLKFISENDLRIGIVVINNKSSGMIRENQINKGYLNLIHTDPKYGYNSIDIKSVAKLFNISYLRVNDNKLPKRLFEYDGPIIIEVIVDSSILLTPALPNGSKLINQFPYLSDEIISEIDLLEKKLERSIK